MPNPLHMRAAKLGMDRQAEWGKSWFEITHVDPNQQVPRDTGRLGAVPRTTVPGARAVEALAGRPAMTEGTP